MSTVRESLEQRILRTERPTDTDTRTMDDELWEWMEWLGLDEHAVVSLIDSFMSPAPLWLDQRVWQGLCHAGKMSPIDIDWYTVMRHVCHGLMGKPKAEPMGAFPFGFARADLYNAQSLRAHEVMQEDEHRYMFLALLLCIVRGEVS